MKNYESSRLILFLFIVSIFSLRAQVQIGNDIVGDGMYHSFGEKISMPNATTIAVAGAGDNDGGQSAGHVKIYEWNGVNWIQKGDDIDGESAYDGSGRSVSMPDANTIAIGATGNDEMGSLSGHVRIFEWDGSNWIQKGADINGVSADAIEGHAVDMPDANTVISGAPHNNPSNPGMIRVHEWNGNDWIQKGGSIYGVDPGDRCGYSVCMPTPNVLATASTNHDLNGTNYGHVRVFEWDGSNWTQRGNNINGEGDWEQYGQSISMPNENTIAISADKSYNDAGYVKVYNWNGSSWVQKGSKIEGDIQFALFAYSVDMGNENIIAVGNPSYGLDQGAVYIYRWISGEWVRDCAFIEGRNLHNLMGINVSMPEKGVVGAGAPTIMIEGNTINHARVFEVLDSLHVGVDNVAACNSFTWIDGVTYNQSNNTSSYTIPGGASNGCDSTVFLDLTINSIDNSIIQNDTSLISNADNISYQWISCENEITTINGETDSYFTPESSGDYAVILSNENCSDTSECYTFNIAGSDEIIKEELVITVHPNPSSGVFQVDLHSSKDASYKLSDALGKLIDEGVFHDRVNYLDLHSETNGLFFLYVNNTVVKLVKK